jgi:hypothetical protein
VRRCRTVDDARALGVRDVLLSRFCPTYVDLTIDRLCADAKGGLYAAIDGATETCVCAFGIVLYDCTFDGAEADDDEDDDVRGVALMVDIFAVKKKTKGFGGNVYYHTVRALARRLSSSYVVFAQCLKRKDAREFWQDKLDESGEARSLLVQALRLDAWRVCVQSEADCSFRARTHRNDVA